LGSLKKFARLPRAEKILLVRAFFLVAAIRLGLWLLQFRVLRRLALPRENSSNGAPRMDRLIWAVRVVSRYIPRATCLTQALAAQALLARSGYETKLVLGFAKDEERPFEAHAWLEYGDQVLIGGPTVERYTPIAAWDTGQ
jgi:hypothetical protein